MNCMLKILPVILIAALLLAGCSNGPAPDIVGIGTITACEEYTGDTLRAGEPAPDFQFQNASGELVALSDFRGKVVLLNFWYTGCYWCKTEMPYLEQVYDEWSEEELVVLAIDVAESADKVTEFLQDEGISLPVLLDSQAKATLQYFKGLSIISFPTTIFIDKDGVVQYIKAGAFTSPEGIENILNQID